MKRHAFYLSYDYTFVSGELRICKVIHNRKRNCNTAFRATASSRSEG
ncbi:MAG: hypothetical protein ACLRTQ_09910 [Candidatus Borkfalkia sp.]